MKGLIKWCLRCVNGNDKALVLVRFLQGICSCNIIFMTNLLHGYLLILFANDFMTSSGHVVRE